MTEFDVHYFLLFYPAALRLGDGKFHNLWLRDTLGESNDPRLPGLKHMHSSLNCLPYARALSTSCAYLEDTTPAPVCYARFAATFRPRALPSHPYQESSNLRKSPPPWLNHLGYCLTSHTLSST